MDSRNALCLGVAACVGAGAAFGYLQRGMEAEQKLEVTATKAQQRALARQLQALQGELEESAKARVEAQRQVTELQAALCVANKEVEDGSMGATQSMAVQSDLVEQIDALRLEREGLEKPDHQDTALQVHGNLKSAEGKLAKSEAAFAASQAALAGAQVDLAAEVKARQQAEKAAASTKAELAAMQQAMTSESEKMQHEVAAVRKQRSEAQQQAQALEEELAAIKQRRKKSFSTLEEISKKLDTVETSWRPWNELNDIKGQVQDSLASEGTDDQLRGA